MLISRISWYLIAGTWLKVAMRIIVKGHLNSKTEIEKAKGVNIVNYHDSCSHDRVGRTDHTQLFHPTRNAQTI
jgi:hypothetical protein